LDTDAGTAWKPSKRPRYGTRLDRSASNTSQTVLSLISGWDWAFARATHWSTNQSLSSSRLFTRTRGENSRSRTVPTWFSTWPFSHAEAGVQATGSTR
jgi:hypothetical protein